MVLTWLEFHQSPEAKYIASVMAPLYGLFGRPNVTWSSEVLYQISKELLVEWLIKFWINIHAMLAIKCSSLCIILALVPRKFVYPQMHPRG